jgi:hypothetical protein
MTGSHDSGEVPAQRPPARAIPPRARARRSEPPRKATVKVPRVTWDDPDRPPSFAATDSDPTPTVLPTPRASSSSTKTPALQTTTTGMAHLPLVPPPGINDEDTLDEPPPPALHPVTTRPVSPRPALAGRINTGEYRFVSSKPPKRDP